jgi:NAD(P)-dependent dehydrogenase (short-subunit alcohol dehydrogenase family)
LPDATKSLTLPDVSLPGINPGLPSTMSSDLDLGGGLAVVTGAQSGIGRAACELLATHRAAVIAVDSDPAVERDGPRGSIGAIRADVRHPRDLDRVGAAIEDARRPLAILVNSAGVVAVGSAMDASADDWQRTFDVNVLGAWRMCRLTVPRMATGASIINIASAAGLRPIPGLAAYSASKAAMISLTRSLAIELGDRAIRANCICPGMIDTPMNEAALSARHGMQRDWPALFAPYALKRLGSPVEIAQAVLYLASDASGYMTGAALAVDGGRALH